MMPTHKVIQSALISSTTFLSSALHGVCGRLHAPAVYPPRKTLGAHSEHGCVGLGAGLDVFKKRNYLTCVRTRTLYRQSRSRITIPTTLSRIPIRRGTKGRGAPKGDCRAAARPQTAQKRNLKNTDFVDIMIPKFYVVSLSAEISH
jgi:hypothetical protein